MDRADVVIIGGGVTGLSSAYWLTTAGLDVAVVEKGIVGWEASGRNGGISSRRGEELPVVPLAREACRLWPTMDEELGYPTEWVGTGGLSPALNDERREFLMGARARGGKLDISARWLGPRGGRGLARRITARGRGGACVSGVRGPSTP